MNDNAGLSTNIDKNGQDLHSAFVCVRAQFYGTRLVEFYRDLIEDARTKTQISARMLDIYAGKAAMETLHKEGFKQEVFTSFLGASGGPKWFCLYQMDRFWFGEFFKDRSSELDLIGSSAGAFRSACFAQQDPVAAIDRLAKNYSETTYSKNAKPAEITRKARELLDIVFGPTGAQEIIQNPIFKAHFVVAKSNGLVSFENKILQGMGLLSSYLRNRSDRNKLNKQYQRVIFKVPSSQFQFSDPYDINTLSIDLNEDNIRDALLASGSIPMVMQGIKDISNAPKGMYRDGGIIDYHFDLKLNDQGLTLYPHFNAQPKSGWFDKSSSRLVSGENYDKTVLLCPSPEFVQTLPFQKIPDRNDFVELDDATRINYWHTVFQTTEKLADSLRDFVARQDLSRVKPMPF